jgi:nicotinamidase/pyrazinamidase
VGLADWLETRGVDEVDVCGIATDHCVRATALDAAGHGFTTRVLTELCAGVAAETTRSAVAEMRGVGITVV